MIVSETEARVDDGELGAVLCALGGPRRGDAVAALGVPAVALRALLAAAGTTRQADDGARVVLTGEGQAPEGRARLAPGGRLVGLAPDDGTARRLAEELGLSLRHVEPVGAAGVAWSAVSPARP